MQSIDLLEERSNERDMWRDAHAAVCSGVTSGHDEFKKLTHMLSTRDKELLLIKNKMEKQEQKLFVTKQEIRKLKKELKNAN